MKEKIKETINSASRDNGKVTSTEVVKSIERGFRDSVKPTWKEWQKDVIVSNHR